MSGLWAMVCSLVQGVPEDRVYGMNRRNVDLVYAHNRRADYPLADDKIAAKEHFEVHGVAAPKTLAICKGLFDVARCVEEISQYDSFVIKPARGSGGNGILVVVGRSGAGWMTAKGTSVDAVDLRAHLANIVFGAYSKTLEDCALIEEKVTSHETLQVLWPSGVCDLRVITLRGAPVMAMLRVPTRRSGGRANLHQGGVGVAVDLLSGVTRSARTGSIEITHHPETKQPLLGIELPHFAEMLAIARRTAQSVPLGYLGIDFAIDQHLGPLVLEINARPGLEIQNVHGFGIGAAIAREAGQ